MAKKDLIVGLYLLAVGGNLISHLIDSISLANYTKPLLMPLLLLYVYESSKGAVTSKTLWLAGALIMSWGGDLALMNAERFLLGVGLFLVAQVLYVILFSKAILGKATFSFKSTIPVLIYGGIFFYLIIPNSGSLAPALIVYGLVLMAMVIMSLHRRNLTTNPSYWDVAIGASLFILSDSMIAYAKFVSSFMMSQFFIMLTYCGAQFLIARGIVKHPS